MQVMKTAAVFLDRDGTINEEVGYLDRLERLTIYPQAGAAIQRLNESGLKALVVTNQSGVARGYFTECFLIGLHRHIQQLLAAEGAYLDGFYYCPHHPEARCRCRKPETGMLLTAAADFGVDLGRSYLIGDTLKDMETAEKAGVKGVLVRTGYGREAEAAMPAAGIGPVHVAADILAAVNWLIRDRKQ